MKINTFRKTFNMPALRTQIRQQNGNYRKQPYRLCQQEYRLTRGLTTNQINLRFCFQTEIMSSNLARNNIIQNVTNLILGSHLVQQLENKNQLLREATRLLRIDENLFSQINNYYIQQESNLCDIDPNVEDVHEYGEPRNRRIEDLSDYQCLQFTRFTKSQLYRILYYFRIPPRLRIENHGGRFYNFSGEEVFLFGLTKLALGLNTQFLCISIFGGSSRRWSPAYRWFIFHLYGRYYPNIIGFNGLEREVVNFPYYAKKIVRKFNQERYYIANNTFEREEVESTTIDENRFNIAMFVDGSVTETATCGTGPNGDFKGTMRKDDSENNQRAIYSGYKKQHGLTSLSLFLPNGMHYIYGPCSMRENDRWLVNRSNCNNFLRDLQNMTPSLGGRLYSAYGDNTFQNSDCIRRAHEGDALNPLPRDLELENNGMKSVRISIEHGFGEVSNSFKVCTMFDEFKLHQEQPYAAEQLLVCYLMINILNTFNGSQVTSLDTFFSNCPSFKEYIALGDEDEM